MHYLVLWVPSVTPEGDMERVYLEMRLGPETLDSKQFDLSPSETGA